MVVSGVSHAVGSKRGAIEAEIKRRKQSMGAGTKIDVRKENGESVARVGAGEANGVYDIVFVTFDKNHSTEVKRGENRGKTLVNARVVREYDMLGSWSGEPVNLRIPIAGRPGNSGCAILVQKREYGEIVAVVSLPFDSSGLSNNRSFRGPKGTRNYSLRTANGSPIDEFLSGPIFG